MIDPRVSAMCEEFSVEIIGKSRYPEPGQTRAVGTLNRILRRYGEDHLRLVMTTLTETANNKACLDEVGLWAASDLVRACKSLIARDASAWLTLWDAIPVGELQAMVQDLVGFVPQRYALGGLIYERIVRTFGPGAAQPDLFDDRRQMP